MEEESEAVERVRKHVKEPLLNQVKKLGNKLREIWSCQDEGKLRRAELVTRELENLFREEREIIQAWRSDFLERVKARSVSREETSERSAESETTEDKVTQGSSDRT